MSQTCLVAQIGARMHYAVPRLLHEEGRLAHLYTDLCAVKGWPRALRLLPGSLRSSSVKRLLGRTPSGVPRSRITALARFSGPFSRRLRQATTPSAVTSAVLWAGQTFCRRVIAKGVGDAGSVYTFNNAGLELLRHARERGLGAIMEQTIAPRQIEYEWLQGEYETFPDWESKPEKDRFFDDFVERQMKEWHAADRIICGSEFVQAGIIQCGGPAERCRVVPYGVDASFRRVPRARPRGPLRVLTVGAIGLRKGSPYVMAASRRLGQVAKFRMVGELRIRPSTGARLLQTVELTGPVPRTEMLPHFQWADVFLLPSLCEGSATAVYEALACGLPVIATANTGTVVRDGIEGFIVPPRDADSIVAALEKLLGSRKLLEEMSRNAVRRSLEFNFAAYRTNLLKAISLSSFSSPSADNRKGGV